MAIVCPNCGTVSTRMVCPAEDRFRCSFRCGEEGFVKSSTIQKHDPVDDH